jgi:peptide/nickel transport system substrate-binding protein
LDRIEIDGERVFTFFLRRGHKWSDGHPFTTEDFRYFWEDVANNAELSPFGLPAVMLVDGEAPVFEVIDEITVRYTWKSPNPFFIPAIAGSRPLYIYSPAHYMKQYHARYGDTEALAQMAKAAGQRNWAALHNLLEAPYKNHNPDLPSLQPWVNTSRPPSQRFVFERNPYFHRVDAHGQQLPYVDRVIINIADSKLIPAKTGAGESDLQARALNFSDYTFLKRSEKQADWEVRLWETTKGSHVALFPNLNANDPIWRALMRDVRFRRALSLAIDRREINQVVYFGLATEGNNTVHDKSPLYLPAYRNSWAELDLDAANGLLDELGLGSRDRKGIRLLSDGRPMIIVVETAGEDSQQTDVLELIHDTWLKIGIKLFTKPLQREVLRSRIYAGGTLMSVWGGWDNAVPTAITSPQDFAPTSQDHLQWPKWGQYFQTKGVAGEPVDMPEAKQLMDLNEAWISARDNQAREEIWRQMLEIHADQLFTIGIVADVPQPVVVNRKLRNVPEKGVYNWDPGAYFGVYRPDTFWFDDAPVTAANQ